MDPIIQQALSKGVGNYINEAIERVSAGASQRAIESLPQLLDFVRRVPDEVWHLLTAGVEGATQVLLARVTNPLLRSVLSAILATLPGLGRGLADAEARRAVLNGINANISTVQVPGQPRHMDRFFHTSNLPGLAHRATYDAAGNPTGTSCQLVAHDRRAHRALNPDRQQGGGRGQPQQVIPGAAYPEDFPTLEAAGQMRLGLCGACFEGGSLPTTAAAPATTLFGKLQPEQRVRLLRVLIWIRRTEDATDDSIVSDLASADIEAVRTALGEGFDAQNNPTETSVEALLAAAGRRPSAASRIENMFRRMVRAIDRRDFSGLWAAFNSLGRVGLIGLFFFTLWGAAVLVSLGQYFAGWWQGDSELWLNGFLWLFAASLFVPIVQKPIKWIVQGVRTGLGRPGVFNESFSIIGLKVVAFCGTFLIVGAGGVEMGYGPKWRVAVAGTAILLITGYFIGRAIYKDMSASEYGLDDHDVRQSTIVRLARSMDRTSVLIGWMALMLIPGYLVVQSIDIPWVLLRAVEHSPAVEVQTGSGPVTVQYAVTTPNPYALRTQHDVEELFGSGAINSRMVWLDRDGTVRSSGLVPNLCGFILRQDNDGAIPLTFSWKPGLTAQTFRVFGSDWYARHCYPEAEVKGTSSASSGSGAQGNSSGGAASANSSEREYLSPSAAGSATLLALIGLAFLIPAMLVRGQGTGAGIVRSVGVLAFLLLGVGALGILGVEGCHGVRESWVEAHRSEQQAKKPASAPSVPPRSASPRPAKAKVEEDAAPPAPPVPLARVRSTEECNELSPVGRDICLANIRKAQANRSL